MSGDRAEGKAEELGGKVKEAVGDATGNEDLEAEGQADQVSGKGKQVVGDIKNAAEDIKKDLSS